MGVIRVLDTLVIENCNRLDLSRCLLCGCNLNKNRGRKLSNAGGNGKSGRAGSCASFVKERLEDISEC